MTERHPGSGDWQPWDRSDASAPEPGGSDPSAAPAPPAPTWAQSHDQGRATPADELRRGDPAPPRSAPTAPYQPISGSWSAMPGVLQTEPLPVTQAAPAPPRRGPGWGALVGATVAAGVLGGTVGGLFGGSLVGGDAAPEQTQRAAAPTPGTGASTRPQGSIANIAATALPSVMTLRVGESGSGSTGSAWVYDDVGHLVTNNHVVAAAGEDEDITVVLSNGEQLTGRVIGRDASYDLAVVKVEGADLAALPLGVSADVVVGDQVIAVGAPLGLDSTVTTGIVSALDRPVTPGDADDQSFINAIQTDAAINPGNSGGPLLDMSGRVIGVNSAIARVPGSSIGGQSGNIGVGFAIPSDQVATTVEQLITTGRAEHPVIGVFLDNGYDGEGVRVAESGPDGQPAVNPDGPADDAGLRAGDVIVKFEGQPVTEDGELVVKIRSRKVGDTVTLTVRRDGEDRDVRMVLQGSE